MKRLGFCAIALLTLTSVILAQARQAPARARGPVATSPAPRLAPIPAHNTTAPAPASTPQVFEDYCFECHGAKDPKGHLSIEQLVGDGTPSVGANWQDWERIADMIESGKMPPKEATLFPTDNERTAASAWIRSSLAKYEADHAGDPGRVTVRRLTSAEYAYVIRDLTGIDGVTTKLAIDSSGDSVGGEGFANYGDVQFVQDASVERYLEAAKVVADHAVIGAGPLEFYADPGKTGLELSALNRINELYASKGFRVVSGEGGRPFGLERYGKALYVAWHYKHRAALKDPAATLRSLAAKEGITGRFAEHIWAVVNRVGSAYPTRTTVEGWAKLPAPTTDIAASVAKARAGCDELYKALTTWPSWFFARGDLAAGGAGDESPLVFDDTTLKVEPTHHYVYPLGARAGRGRGAPAPAASGPSRVFLTFASVNPSPGVTPVVIWRNARVVLRGPGTGPQNLPTGGRGRGATGPVLSTRPLREVLSPEAAAALKFGTSPDGTPLGPDDFATTEVVSFQIDPPRGGNSAELQVDAELGKDRNAVVRLMLTDRPEGSNRDASQRTLLGDASSAGYRAFRAGIAEYVASLPPNSHGEANPADKDPVPPPFDNTYNSPEHDAFVLKVKYQRNDAFFTENLVDGPDRARLNQAWTDLFGSWPYHDAYLGMLIDHYGLKLKSPRIADLTAAAIAAQPAAARPYLTKLRAHYDEVVRAGKLAEPGHIADAIALASRAWRRPLTQAERTGLRGFYDTARTVHKLDHDGALRALLARILVSPAFLYRVESTARGPERALDSWELASRMSFFLWSSIPDEELRRAAAAGELESPAMLARQVRRMTADPKARRLATEFFGQWLGFYHFNEYRGVDTGRFPEFTDEVKSAMYDEAISTFEYIVRHDRPVREVLHADYTFLNKPLAKFYGLDAVPGVEVKSSDKVERVDGAGAFNRGGALRLGSVLTATSAPLRTSPVKRGDWVLRRILGTPTPPPPADAGTIPADDKTFNGLTLRERLAEHKRNATCASCHLRIDPLGFPLESFDAVGRIRTAYADGKAVDVTGEFADSTTIVGTDGLLKYLQSRDAQVMTTMSRKMLGYALGRTVMVSDRPLIRSMTEKGGAASFADLAVKVVSSRQFRHRAVETAGVAASSSTPQAASR
jgi:mono/diheme cytochrome c family protein